MAPIQLNVRNGCVYFHDSALSKDIIALTPFEAQWFANFLRMHLTSELIVQLQLAALAANSETEKTFPLQRG